MEPDEAGGCDISVMKTFYPHTMQGFDKLNRPILWEMDGKINAQAIATMTTKEGLLGYHFWTMNTKLDSQFTRAKDRSPLPGTWSDSGRESKESNKPATVFNTTEAEHAEKDNKYSSNPINTIAVMDMTDFGMAQCTNMCMEQLKLFISTDNVCYPETLGKMLVVNAPMLLTATWNIVKGWLDPRTVNKIEILSPAQSQARIKEFVDIDNIPAQYGGKGPDLYSPHPDCEFLWLGRGGEVTREFVVPAGQHLTVDSYVSDGAVECSMSSRPVASSDETGMRRSSKGRGSFFGSSSTKAPAKGGDEVIIQGHMITPKDGLRERYLKKIRLDGASAHEVTVTWKNTSRYSQRPLVYAFTPFSPTAEETEETE
jgi:hypothetical protein